MGSHGPEVFAANGKDETEASAIKRNSDDNHQTVDVGDAKRLRTPDSHSEVDTLESNDHVSRGLDADPGDGIGMPENCASTGNALKSKQSASPETYAVDHFGRTLPCENGLQDLDDVYVLRTKVLCETLRVLQGQMAHFHDLAKKNMQRWKEEAKTKSSATNGADGQLTIVIEPGDWGEVTGKLTAEWGQTFAVLNMANAYCPGGGYVEGCPAQEENMFRRTDCHFSIPRADLDEEELYFPAQTELLNAVHGRVYLDANRPRVCVRGREEAGAPGLGYRWLSDDQIFPFYELRAAAKDLRDGSRFDVEDLRRRVRAQLQTLREANIRHVVLSAFGCGAFKNPAKKVATVYKEEIDAVREHFDCVAFAIFAPGYGPDNYTPFKRVFETETDEST
mmetsp:Transcript_27298/g.53191  ORF Transcript_27298/g.53191 Transcript_27298/m.53191 type:complete len:393 (+) Transcript_27298:134-1312(+)